MRCFSTIPATMKCVDITKYGPPEVVVFALLKRKVMKIVTRDVPETKEGEFLIKVASCALNRPDVIQAGILGVH